MIAGNCAMASNPEITGPRLLITEDDSPLRLMLTWEFEELGYQVTSAASCAEALAVIDHGFDRALLDYNLPDGVGTELLQQLRQHCPELQVLVCSGRGTAERAAIARACGACGFINKPVTAQGLHRRFRELLDAADHLRQ